MQYQYNVYQPLSRENLAAQFTTQEALPGIVAGNHLLLESPEFSTRTGTHQKICEVETYLFVTESGLENSHINVFLEVEDVQ